MKRLAWTALVAGFSLFAPLALAQTGTARGKVVDEKGEAVEGAVVTLEFLGGVTQKMETRSNKKGEFIQVGMRPGMYKITFTKDGYQGGVTQGRINLGDPTSVGELKLTSGAAAAASRGGELAALFQKAIEHAQAGRLDEAEAAFKEALAKNPSRPELVHFNLGFVYTQKKDWASAEAAYEKAIESKPDYGEAHLALFRVYEESGQKEKAEAALNRAAAGGEGDGKIQFALGITHLNAGRNTEAGVALEKAVALDPANAEAHYHLATVLLNQNKIPEAVASLEKYLSLNPANAQNKATAEALLQALKPKK
jgi:Tfp pilus assembly protein PilF